MTAIPEELPPVLEPEIEADGIPRRTIEPDPILQLRRMITELSQKVAKLSKNSDLRNSSISGGEGMVVKDDAGVIRLRISTEEAAIIAYKTDGSESARYGLLAHSDPGEYGIEALTDSGWSHVGAGVADWATLDGKPSTFPPSSHTHPGSQITSAVANATAAVTATSATTATSANTAAAAALAEGSSYAFNNNVSGSQFYAVWVGNDGGFHLGRNTSSIRYKQNVRDAGDLSPKIMSLRPVVYDRKPSYRPVLSVDGEPAVGPQLRTEGAKNEFGMIAEEVAEVWPEVVTHFDGEIDGIRYDLIGPRLIPYVQHLLDTVSQQDKLIKDLVARVDLLDGGGTA
ncbi:minor tail protein [Arthrobacter phage Nubia]|uniref:Minor tail protein n=5 Tax=Korravirus TaxID=1982076 RepID=A0A3S9UCG2_9CAUD|nr:minor tail protein [Arthrobacter phage Joann]YP_010049941.1 minor tail protein [Arthrobacter phage GreenHearts]YP_010050312.1 minor tail protein [Arthrobacter phage Nubia]YP_010050373.1 minor tail protein [Arthrobacter phage Oxynfrius]UYL86748.1 minor tail protein [Arthrobacter phage Albanese]WKW85578.1 minor tail protein [Arthrobacter phage Lakshmi]ALY09424.1 minor tail protein [Arthrobacter phage Joann]AOZ65062.1 minor tail protein [Arthrobacter phage Oxynfrius]ASR83754.1 minor tail pr